MRTLLFALLLPVTVVHAQDPSPVIRQWMQDHHASIGLSIEEARAFTITSSHTDRKGVTYAYIQQHVHGLPVFGAVANFAIRDGEVIHFGNRLIANISDQAPSASPALDAIEALHRAADHLNISVIDARVLIEHSPVDLKLSSSGISHDPIPAKLIFQPVKDEGLRLAWDFTIRSTSSPNWWRSAVDAIDGRILRQTDLIVDCDHEEYRSAGTYNAMDDLAIAPPALMPPDGAGYRAFAFPTESPSHGPHELKLDPAHPIASPYGWHDTNGAPGAEHTITRGNNVFAYEDMADQDSPGYSPDGGGTLFFDFPYDQQQQPIDHLDASITNLFYTCNVLHDVWHRYGFDEASGNFQVNNYGNDGWGEDAVVAEAQDGGGNNNANFGTPPDGSSGRMQMYLWRTSGDSTLYITAPASIAGSYTNVIAGFGPPLPLVPITADIELVEDPVPPVNDGCETILNSAQITGSIALVDRGECTFVSKVEALQAAGALAVIVVNNVPGDPIGMGGSGGGDITIPSVMISQADGDLIKQALLDGPVNATLIGTENEEFRDSGFDNGIIAHEYGHGVSNRLTGGGLNVDCLWNEEQMGEGWSDYMGLVLTMRPGDGPTTVRGVGTFVRDQEIDGNGIRPAPYTTDLSINGYTYDDTNDPALTQPHGVGFVWATMLWDLTWAFIDQYGLDPDVYNGSGGNNMAIQLMMDGLKLQPCNPGFVDGRDAILMADQLNNGGVNECLIWNTFAQRGLGFSASQGSAFDRFDQLEAFDLPPACLNVGITDRSGISHDMILMPNPANDQVSITLKNALLKDAELRLIGSDGRTIMIERIPAGRITLDLGLGGIAPGIYVIELRSGDLVLKERLVVQ